MSAITRWLFLGSLGVAACSPNLGAVPAVNDPSKLCEDEFRARIRYVAWGEAWARGLKLDPAAANSFASNVEAAATETRLKVRTKADMEDAENGVRLWVDALAQGAQNTASMTLGDTTVDKTLFDKLMSSVCPVYPICK